MRCRLPDAETVTGLRDELVDQDTLKRVVFEWSLVGLPERCSCRADVWTRFVQLCFITPVTCFSPRLRTLSSLSHLLCEDKHAANVDHNNKPAGGCYGSMHTCLSCDGSTHTCLTNNYDSFQLLRVTSRLLFLSKLFTAIRNKRGHDVIVSSCNVAANKPDVIYE